MVGASRTTATPGPDAPVDEWPAGGVAEVELGHRGLPGIDAVVGDGHARRVARARVGEGEVAHQVAGRLHRLLPFDGRDRGVELEPAEEIARREGVAEAQRLEPEAGITWPKATSEARSSTFVTVRLSVTVERPRGIVFVRAAMAWTRRGDVRME